MFRFDRQEIIFVMGGPGSGKGTHSKTLADKRQYIHISTGDLVRAVLANTARENDPEIAHIKETMQSGKLLDDQMIFELLIKEMQKHPKASTFLIDGFPRTTAQLDLFNEKVRPCDRVLYFNVSEAERRRRILKRSDESKEQRIDDNVASIQRRILKRSDESKEQRIDDNVASIQRRAADFCAMTLPVIDELKAANPKSFIEIKAEGSFIETAKQVNEKLVAHPMAKVGLFEFAKTYYNSGSFYKTVDTLEEKYHVTDFSIEVPHLYKFKIIQNPEQVSHILKRAHTDLGYQYDYFNHAHNHELNVVAMQAFDPKTLEVNSLWHNIHAGLSGSVGGSDFIKKLMAKHIPTFFTDNKFYLDVAFENFMLNFWCEFMFGEKVDAQKFKATRTKLLDTLRYTYYGNRLKDVPEVGKWSCMLYRMMKRKELAQIDRELQAYLDRADSGLFYRFKQALLSNPDFPKELVDKAILDNAFVFVLVFDFSFNAIYETLVSIVKNQVDETEQRKQRYAEGLSRAYLFQFRSRKALEPITLDSTAIAKGETVYINMLKGGVPHSAGPRGCYGMAMTNYMKEAIWEYLTDRQLRLISTSYPAEREALSHSLDIPMSPERYEVSWQFSRDYVQKRLPHYDFRGVKEFYDVLKIHEEPELSKYIASSFVDMIKSANLDKSNLCIASPEVRGVPVASMVADRLGVPLVILRKPGKIPGKTISRSYHNAYSEEKLETPVISKLTGRNVVLVDDGIASGATTLMACDSVNDPEVGGKIVMVLAMINHTYKTKVEDYGQIQGMVKTLFDFAAKAPEKVVESKEEKDSAVAYITSGTSSLYKQPQIDEPVDVNNKPKPPHQKFT